VLVKAFGNHLTGNGLNSSRLGFRATEDLGWYARYAGLMQGRPGWSTMAYISSHDTELFDRLSPGSGAACASCRQWAPPDRQQQE